MMKKPFVAVVAGGYSGEHSVSLKSAAGILSWLGQDPFATFLVLIEQEGWSVQIADGKRVPLDKNDFSFENEGERIRFDYAYITIHGTPGENGLLQGYLDMIGIPYSTGDTLVESLTFNKYVCNRFLSGFGIRIADSVRLTESAVLPDAEGLIVRLGLPLFVKPNVGGSSIATTKVAQPDKLLPAIAQAFAEGKEVMVERLIVGTEVTCGAFRREGKIVALPVTEVVAHNEFFDFDAKYNGAVEEITPARISDELTVTIQRLTTEIYEHLNARGIIRVDYIIEADGVPTLLEVNTTPGMTPTSFIPQQVRAAGMEMKEVLCSIIQEGLSH